MGRAERVVLALHATRKAGEAAFLTERVEPGIPAGQDLVPIGLVAHVPDEDVPGGIVDRVERDRDLHRAEAWGEMPARARDDLDDPVPDFLRELRERLPGEPLEIAWVLDAGQMVRAHMPPGGR